MNREVSVLRDKDKGENEVKTYRRKRKSCSLIKNLTAFAIAAGVFWVMSLTSLAAEGEVTANANIRAQASTGSEVVASATKGKKIDILDAVKDSSGAVWYKVSVAGGGYGYIRSDMVKTSETITVSSTATLESPEQPSSSSSQPEATVPTAIEEQQAVIKCDSNARIRSGASTNHSVVTSLPNGTGVTLIGEANDSAGSKWYQIKCDYNGRSIEGYIKANLITIGQAPATDTPSEGEGDGEPSEGENPEGGEGENPEGGEGENPEEAEPEPEPEESHGDYEVVWENEEYYLYDYTAGGKTKISVIKDAINYVNEQVPKLQETAKTNKIIMIVLAGVIVLLVIIVTILIFKIRSLYYDDYDEEDEEEEEEPEPEPVRKKVRRRVIEEEEPEPAPVRKKRPVPREEAGQRTSERPARPRKEGQPELRAAERKEGVKKPASRKPQNFLVDDDEFEFEFLNMDDKDL